MQYQDENDNQKQTFRPGDHIVFLDNPGSTGETIMSGLVLKPFGPGIEVQVDDSYIKMLILRDQILDHSKAVRWCKNHNIEFYKDETISPNVTDHTFVSTKFLVWRTDPGTVKTYSGPTLYEALAVMIRAEFLINAYKGKGKARI